MVWWMVTPVVQPQSPLLRDRLEGPFLGLDSVTNLKNLDPKFLVVADNTNIEASGAASKRSGYTSLLTAAWGSNAIQNGIEARFSGGVKLLLAGRGAAPGSGAFGYVTDTSFSGVTNISTGLTTTRPSLVQFSGLVFYYNGNDDFLYDGTNTRQIGITQPVNAPTPNATINGSLTVGAIYKYCYTYYNSTTGAESSPSPILTSAAVAADPNDGFRINITAGVATTADTIRVWRTLANEPIFYLDGTTAIASTTYDSTVADTGLGVQLAIDNTRPGIYGTFPYATVLANRVYLTGRSAKPNRVQISAVYQDGPKPESFPVKNFVDCESHIGSFDTNVGLGVAGDNLIVMKKYSIGRIDKIGVDTTQQSDDPVLFGYSEISRSVTCVSHFAGCNLYNEWVWLGSDNIYATDGNQIRTVADNVRSLISGFNYASPDTYTAFNDTVNKRLYFSVRGSSTNGNPDWILVGHYFDYPKIAWTIYRPGIDTVSNPGVMSGCFINVSEFVSKRIVFGNNQYSGKLYYLNNGTNDDTKGIYWRVRFAPRYLELNEEEKHYKKDYVNMQGLGTNYNVTVESFYNLSATSSESELLSLYANGSNWGAVNWGSFYWATNAPLILGHNLNTKAFCKQLQLSNFNADEPVSVFGFETSAYRTYIKG